ncbi:DNA (cytosine-5-)-methyltransferase [Slackia faecicanis]|uniref:Cytosine-specific methyltransferase n=1 Tax=Slackia faecicanis TaxID=255723 RepID=A0A3N0AH49_9ACTN|nr:DNA cytosine methyltransferase [Slackia faecicanis]RNL20829.1 DNA (cytosine-5-)-methyltransferase [Slackia faecicanis]
MRYLSLFSGIEAASVAWEPLGWEPVAFCEVDAFPSAVLAHRWPDVPNLGDITKVDWSEYARGKRKPDVVVGGSPCQSFSVAGNREGLAGESGLMFEYIRAVQCIMPGCFVWENVPGAFTSEDGEAFRQLLSEMDALGYGLAWRVLDAQFFGVAQRRERVFLVGCLGDPRRAARILFEPDGLRWDTPSSREKRQELAARAGRGPAGEGGAVAKTLQVRCGCEGGGKGALVQDDMSATLSTSQTQTVFAPVCLGDDNAKAACDVDMCGALKVGGSAPIMGGAAYEVRRLMPVECERLQGFPDGHTDLTGADPDALFERMAREDMDEAERKKLRTRLRKWCKACPDTPRYKACGNSMAVPVMRWIGERIAMTEGGR